MTEVALSRLQFVVIGLICDARLFTNEDLAHLQSCEVKLNNSTMDEPCLLADAEVYFRDWSYTDQKESSHEAHRMPAEVRVVLSQDQNRKLTGRVEVGFFAEDPVLVRQLDFIKGW